ncbi:MAG: hypothetical protein RIT45_2947, partial [Pseudomonadota bacterium]
MRRWSRSLLPPWIAALLLLLPACASDDDDASSCAAPAVLQPTAEGCNPLAPEWGDCTTPWPSDVFRAVDVG